MHYMLERHTPFYANKLGISSRKLNLLVRQTTGRDLPSLITSRLQTECEAMLAQTTKPIKAIAYELGFNSAAHFSYFFRKQSGHTPKQFRTYNK
jgi:AraC-like DNA-binding protein